jgi:hypothetical protein
MNHRSRRAVLFDIVMSIIGCLAFIALVGMAQIYAIRHWGAVAIIIGGIICGVLYSFAVRHIVHCVNLWRRLF